MVSVSSRGHHRSPVRFDDLDWRAEPYDKWAAYGQSKTANVLFAVHLDALAADRGVRAFSLHPGGIMTPLQRHLPREEMVALGWLDENGDPTPAAAAGFKTPEAGCGHRGVGGDVAAARRSRRALPRGLRGRQLAAETRRDRGVRDYAVDPEAAARLWAVSAERTGVDAFA